MAASVNTIFRGNDTAELHFHATEMDGATLLHTLTQATLGSYHPSNRDLMAGKLQLVLAVWYNVRYQG